MPASNPWLQRPYKPAKVPTGGIFFHVFNRRYEPLAGNPWSAGRFALAPTVVGEPSDFRMFYVATSLAGALWEVALRDVQPDEERRVSIPSVALQGLSVVKLQLLKDDVPLFDLRQPGLRQPFPNVDSHEAQDVARLCVTGEYDATHREAWQLQRELIEDGHDMPFLAWKSRMHSDSSVYLGYQPPLQEDWWRILSHPVALDGPQGHARVRRVLAEAEYEWLQLEDGDTDPDPGVDE